jgi:hypothetical protein
MLRRSASVRAAGRVVSAVTEAGEPLRPELSETLEPLLCALREPLAEATPAELSFSNLFLFREVRGWRYHAGPLPHIAGRSYDGAPQLLPLFDLTEADSATLRAMQGEHGWFCPVADVVLTAKDRNEALVAIMMSSLDKASTILRQATQFDTAKREIPRALER